MTNRDPWVAFFDQAARPSRLVLGKKFFHIWFIYTREGCVLVLHLFFCKVSFMKHPSVSGCVLYSSKICDEFFMINDDCQWTKIFYSLLHPSSVVIAGRLGPAWVQRRIQLTARPRDPALKCPGLWNYTSLFESFGGNCLMRGIIVRHKDQLSWP